MYAGHESHVRLREENVLERWGVALKVRAWRVSGHLALIPASRSPGRRIRAVGRQFLSLHRTRLAS
jgi:hypothetical protein